MVEYKSCFHDDHAFPLCVGSLGNPMHQDASEYHTKQLYDNNCDGDASDNWQVLFQFRLTTLFKITVPYMSSNNCSSTTIFLEILTTAVW